MTTVPPASASASALPAPARRRTLLTPGRALAWVSLAVMIVISVFPIFIVLKTALTTNQALFGEAGTLWAPPPPP